MIEMCRISSEVGSLVPFFLRSLYLSFREKSECCPMLKEKKAIEILFSSKSSKELFQASRGYDMLTDRVPTPPSFLIRFLCSFHDCSYSFLMISSADQFLNTLIRDDKAEKIGVLLVCFFHHLVFYLL